MSRTVRVVVCVAACVLTLHAGLIAGKKKIDRKNLPSAILQAFEGQYPSATVKGIVQTVGREGTTYTLECVDSSVVRTLLYQPDGKLVESKASTPPGELPALVLDALKARYPSAVIRSAATVTREGHVEYELTVTAGRRKFNAVVNAAGKLFKVR